MDENIKYFYVLSFTALNQSGLAIILAYNETEAFSDLKREGRYNGTPEKYFLVQARNVGKYCGGAHGLMLESYTNALTAFDAIVSVADKIVGPIGPVGQEGPTGPEGPMCEIRVGSVSELPIGSQPTVNIIDKDDYYEIDFGIPKYDISTEALAALKTELKAYIDSKFSEVMTALNAWKSEVESGLSTWKDGVEDDIAGFRSDVTDWMEENERVLANALVRHEQQLEG